MAASQFSGHARARPGWLAAARVTQSHLLRLRDTALRLPVAADIGKPLHDRSGRLIGYVTDFLIEERTVDEAVEAGDRSNSWGARPVYAVVRLHHRFSWPARFVYVPATGLCSAGRHLTTAIPVQSFTRALKRTEL